MWGEKAKEDEEDTEDAEDAEDEYDLMRMDWKSKIKLLKRTSNFHHWMVQT